MKKLTIQELYLERAALSAEVDSLRKADEKRRAEFKKAFGFQPLNDYHMNSGNELTWSQIFVEVGKLLSIREKRQSENEILIRVSALEDVIKDLADSDKSEN